MPSQLINNSAVYFMCARDFTFNGKDYKMGDIFDQDESLGRIDTLVRTRRLIAVVDDGGDKPRHWHHHVWLRSEISKKLGLIHREDSDILTGESLYNKPKQLGSKDASDSVGPDSETRDEGQELHDAAVAAALTQQVLQQENEEDEQFDTSLVATDEDGDPIEVDGVIQTETPDRIEPGEGNDIEDDEERYEEEDLYDPADHSLSEVQEYLKSDITPEEKQRVIAVEKTGKNRKGIVNA